MSRNLITTANPTKISQPHSKKNCSNFSHCFHTILEAKKRPAYGQAKPKNHQDKNIVNRYKFIRSLSSREVSKKNEVEYERDQVSYYIPQINPCIATINPDDNSMLQGKIAADINEEINRLIKKMHLSFTAKKNEARLLIDQGIFQGSDFHIWVNNKNLSLKISHAPLTAKAILSCHSDVLKERLQKHEINLQNLMFVS